MDWGLEVEVGFKSMLYVLHETDTNSLTVLTMSNCMHSLTLFIFGICNVSRTGQKLPAENHGLMKKICSGPAYGN